MKRYFFTIFFGILAGFLAYLGAAPYVTLVVTNIFVFVVNIIYGVWFWIRTIGNWLVTAASFVDSLVCSLSFNPVLGWTIVGAVVALVVSLLISVQGLRRSYFRLNLGFTIGAVLFLIIVFWGSVNVYQAFQSRQAMLKSDENLVKVVCVGDSTVIVREGPAVDENVIGKFVKPHLRTKIYIQAGTVKSSWQKIKYNSLKGLSDAYIPADRVTVATEQE